MEEEKEKSLINTTLNIWIMYLSDVSHVFGVNLPLSRDTWLIKTSI